MTKPVRVSDEAYALIEELHWTKRVRTSTVVDSIIEKAIAADPELAQFRRNLQKGQQNLWFPVHYLNLVS